MSTSDKEKIVAIMKANSAHSYLATCDGDQPRLRRVSPIVEDDMTVWVMTYSASRKVQQIKHNPKTSLSFEEHPSGEKSATVIGKIEFVDNLDERKRVWDLAPYDPSQHFPKGPESEEFCLMKILIDQVEWRDGWTFPPNVYESG